MTEREEIDMLRRAVADLTERVRALEARPAGSVYAPPNLVPSPPAAPFQPDVPWWLSPVIGGVSPTIGNPTPPWTGVSTAIGGGPRDGVAVQSWG